MKLLNRSRYLGYNKWNGYTVLVTNIKLKQLNGQISGPQKKGFVF
jgi:hypothetical protein